MSYPENFTSEELLELKVGDLVAKNYKTADIFKSYGIDFCCGGKISIREACAKKGVDQQELAATLAGIWGSAQPSGDRYNDWSVELLIDYIINQHHSYVQQTLPAMFSYMQKVARVHGGRNPELIEMFNLVSELQTELTAHLEFEEQKLFPFIKSLSSNKNEFTVEQNAEMIRELTQMEDEHDHAGSIMKTLRELSNDFTPPADACTTYRVLFQHLEAFEADLHKHVHLENNILQPKAMALLN